MYGKQNAPYVFCTKTSLLICVYVTGVEALVGWLLDHPDVHITEVSDADTVSDDYSDEEVVEELEEPEPAFPVVSLDTRGSQPFFNKSPLDLNISFQTPHLPCVKPANAPPH